jgi:acyl carrier protein
MRKEVVDFPNPLERFSESELEHALRGFSEFTISSALALREESSPQNLIPFLIGVLAFYLPPGATLPEEMPNGDARLREDIGLDSLSLAEAMYKIEELFGIRLESAEIAEVFTVGEASGLLQEKLRTLS